MVATSLWELHFGIFSNYSMSANGKSFPVFFNLLKTSLNLLQARFFRPRDGILENIYQFPYTQRFKNVCLLLKIAVTIHHPI